MLSSELQDKLQQFVESQIAIRQLEEWLVPRLPVFLRSPHSPDADAIAVVELGLADLSNGTKTIDELRNEIKAVLRKYHTTPVFYLGNQRTESGTASHTEHLTFEFSQDATIIMRVWS